MFENLSESSSPLIIEFRYHNSLPNNVCVIESVVFQVLIKMLPSYYKHVCRYENSLVTKFFGVHCVKPVGGVKVWSHC